MFRHLRYPWHIVVSCLIATSVVYFAFLQPAHAVQSIPYKINFQGRLTDSTGTIMADGLYNMKFRIFDAATAGTQLWTETRETTNRVQVTNGLFSVQLGDVTALSPSLFTSSSPIYFEIELPTPATATCSTSACGSFTEGAMTPRNPLGASAYAFNADTIDGIDGASLAQLSTANTFTNTMTIGSTNSASKFVVQDTGSSALLTVDTLNTKVTIGVADSTGVIFVLDTKNTAGDPTGVNGAMYYNSSAGVNKFRCYQNGAWGDCIGGGGSSSLQNAYDTSATANPQILLSSANGGIKIQDGTTPVTGNLFQIGPNGSTTTAYLGVSASAVTLQDAAGNNALLFDSTTSHLKVYENAASPTRFADVYYDTATSSAIFAASSGTTQIGTPGGSGSINLLLTGTTDQLLASKTNTLAAAYSTNDFKFTRNLAAGANTVTGNVMTVEDLTTFSGTNSANVLYVNQNSSSATGNLILAQTGGGANDKFKVNTSGTVTIAAGQSYTSAGSLTLDSASATALNIGTGANAHTTTLGNATGASGLVFNSGSAGAIFNSVASGQTLFTSGSNVPTIDQVKIDNTGSTGVVTADIAGIQINYKGGAAAVESEAARIDVIPGTTSGGTWSGMRIVAGTTGPATGVTLYGIKLEGPTSQGTGSETGMYIGTGWDTGLDVQSGGLNLAGYTSAGLPADPASPAAGNLRVYAKNVAGRMMLKWKAPSGVDTALQPSLAFNTINLWAPASGTTGTGTGFGTVWPAATGTVSHPAPVGGDSTQLRRMRLANVVTTTNQILGLTASTAALQQFYTGDAVGRGGFFMQTRFTTELVPANTIRLFVGLTSMTTGASATDTPTGDMAGLSHITTDNITTMAFMTRDNTTTTRATFTVPTIASGNAYDFTMYCPPNGTTIYYRLVSPVNGTVIVDSSTSTTIPRNTIFMGPQVQMSNGTANITVTTTAIGINKIYLESDN